MRGKGEEGLVGCQGEERREGFGGVRWGWGAVEQAPLPNKPGCGLLSTWRDFRYCAPPTPTLPAFGSPVFTAAKALLVTKLPSRWTVW